MGSTRYHIVKISSLTEVSPCNIRWNYGITLKISVQLASHCEDLRSDRCLIMMLSSLTGIILWRYQVWGITLWRYVRQVSHCEDIMSDRYHIVKISCLTGITLWRYVRQVSHCEDIRSEVSITLWRYVRQVSHCEDIMSDRYHIVKISGQTEVLGVSNQSHS